MQCDLPKECVQIIYAGYEIGEGKSVSNHVKVTCRLESGNYATFIEWQFNGWGIFGLNRVGTSGMRIEFRKSESEKLKCS